LPGGNNFKFKFRVKPGPVIIIKLRLVLPVYKSERGLGCTASGSFKLLRSEPSASGVGDRRRRRNPDRDSEALP
jgi:hypothetical protein